MTRLPLFAVGALFSGGHLRVGEAAWSLVPPLVSLTGAPRLLP